MAPLPKEASGTSGGLEMRERRNIGQAELDEIGKRKRARFRDVSQGAAADVVVVGRVRKRADADAVQNDPDDAVERGHGLRAPSVEL